MSYELRFAFTSVISGLSFFASVSMVPLLSNEMHLSLTENSWLLGISSIAVILFSPLWGSLSDRLGKRKPFLMGGAVVFAVTAILHYFAPNFLSLLVIRFVQGAALATGSTLSALFSDHFGSRASKVFGFFSGAGALGFGLGSLIGGVVAELFAIRVAFLFSGIIGIFYILMIYFALPESPLSQRSASKAPLPSGVRYLYATVLVRQTAAMALWSIFPIYLLTFVDNKALIGAVNSVNMLVQPFFMVLMGRWAERWDRLAMVMWGILGSVATFLVLGMADNLWLIVLGQLMIAISWSALFIGVNLFLIQKTSEDARGRAFGYLQTAFTTAAVTGPLVGGPLSDAFNIHNMIFIVSGLMTLSLFFLWRLRWLERANSNDSSRTKSHSSFHSSAVSSGESSPSAGK